MPARKLHTMSTLLFTGCLLAFIAQADSRLDKGLSAYDSGDYHAAYSYWLPLAQHDHSEAQLFLGVLYRYGLGVESNPQQSAYWYQRSAENGDIDAQSEIGSFYELGWGVKQDFWEAASWYDLVLEQDMCLSDTLSTGRLTVPEGRL